MEKIKGCFHYNAFKCMIYDNHISIAHPRETSAREYKLDYLLSNLKTEDIETILGIPMDNIMNNLEFFKII